MALCPFAVIKLLHPEAEDAPRIVPTQHIRHTAVTKATSLYGYFARADVTVESHFYIAEDGTLEQYVDTEQRADAQFDGNMHGVSTETWDDGDPDHTPWTDAQLATDERLSLWLAATHNMPLTVCAGPQEAGQGYHSLFKAWARDGHTCPNGLRIGQFNDVLLPRLAGTTISPAYILPEDIEMPAPSVVISNGPDGLDEYHFVRGIDGTLCARTKHQPWRSLGGNITSGPSAAPVGDGRIVVTARGGDTADWRLVINADLTVAEPWASLGGLT